MAKTNEPVDETLGEPGSNMILNHLQQMVNAETFSRNLYWLRSALWRSVGLIKLADYYLRQSQEDHAQRNADRLLFLSVPGEGLSVSPVEVHILVPGKTLEEQFKEDLEVEGKLAASYREGIKLAESEEEKDYGTAGMWREVLKSTEEHIDWLKGQIKQIELMGLGVYLDGWR